jgi:hypothetical protein
VAKASFINSSDNSVPVGGLYSTAADGRGRDILALAIAYARQERRYGGLAKPVAKELERLLARVFRDGATTQPTTMLLPRAGTILVREWHGITHHVTMTEGGFVWNGKTHQSLSARNACASGTGRPPNKLGGLHPLVMSVVGTRRLRRNFRVHTESLGG